MAQLNVVVDDDDELVAVVVVTQVARALGLVRWPKRRTRLKLMSDQFSTFPLLLAFSRSRKHSWSVCHATSEIFPSLEENTAGQLANSSSLRLRVLRFILAEIESEDL